ncbi:MAG: rhodanese-like domain-containing protein [Buchananella hordeovulneris]|nr:rhodanese-like domain-containing protein [Buchananella hordeovulneris]
MNLPSSGDITVDRLDFDSPIPEGYTLIDVREDDEWEAGHAPGAVHIPSGELADSLDELPEGDLIIVCHGGGRSSRACKMLAENGIDALNLAGGMVAWAAAGLPLVSEDGDVPRVD